MLQACAILGAGLMSGTVELISAYHQAKIVATGIESIGSGHDVFAKPLFWVCFLSFMLLLLLLLVS
jgi:V/A-type H+-transporting ATPase subunit K